MSSLPPGLPSDFPGAPIQIVPSGTPQPGAQAVPVSLPLSSGQGLLPPTKWIVALVVMAGGLLLLSESKKYGEVAEALGVVIAFGAFTWNYQAVLQEIDSVFGTTLVTQFTPKQGGTQ